jgi:hypothetical protein
MTGYCARKRGASVIEVLYQLGRRRGLLTGFWPRSQLSGRCEGFCRAPHVLVPAPAAPNPAIYRVLLYQTCTFSVPFRRKTARNRGCGGEPVFAASGIHGAGANWGVALAAGARKPPHYRPESLPPEIPPIWPPGPRTEIAYAAPTNAREGRFRPKKRHSRRVPPKTFHSWNDLAAKTPRSSDLTGPSRQLDQSSEPKLVIAATSVAANDTGCSRPDPAARFG